MTTLGVTRFDGTGGAAASNAIYSDYYQAFLGPKEYHYRLPWYGAVTGLNSVNARLDTQAKVDSEILMAAECGIDYFACVWYPEAADYIGGTSNWHRGMNNGSEFHMSSPYALRTKFCVLADGGAFTLDYPNNGSSPAPTFDVADWPIFQAKLVSMMIHPAYMTVLGGRPLFYWLFPSTLATHYGLSTFQSCVADLRAAVQTAGGGNPYIVAMGVPVSNNPTGAATVSIDEKNKVIGQAITGYCEVLAGSVQEYPYSDLTDAAEALWLALGSRGVQTVPIGTAGWNYDPVATAVIAGQYPNNLGESTYAARAARCTPAQVGAHVAALDQWVGLDNSGVCEAQTSLFYAWSEIAEGGWLVPTRDDGGRNIQAIAQYRQKQRANRGALRARGLARNSR